MDLIYRKKKYQEFLSKLNELQGADPHTNDEGDTIVTINNQLSKLLGELKGKADLIFAKNAYGLLSIPLCLMLIYNSYQDGLGAAFYLLILLLLFFAVSHLIMKNLIKANREKSKPLKDIQEPSIVYTWDKMNYASSVIDLKMYRLTLLATFYLLFFPVFLCYLYQLVFLDAASIVVWILAFILSTGYWTIYFYEDITFYQKLKGVLEGIKNQLTSVL